MKVRLFAVVVPLAAVVAAALASAGVGARADATVRVFPSSTTIPAASDIPSAAATSVSLSTAIGEQEDAIVVVTGAQRIAVSAPAAVGPLPLHVFFGHYVSFGSTLRPDALLPWDGRIRDTEQPNQPVWLQLTVPYGTAPGTYTGSIQVSADGVATAVPVSVRVSSFELPRPGDTTGALPAAFHTSAETYVGTVAELNHLPQSEQRRRVNSTLFPFLASYRLSPSSWGFGEPSSRAGYTKATSWFRSPATTMLEQLGDADFTAMRIPISNNRTRPSNYIAGLSPYEPEQWCDYLRSVHSFWEEHGWLSSLAYLHGLDEAGAKGFKVVQRQAAVLHSCFPGGKELVTGNPSEGNKYLWDGGNDDVDIWTVLATRFYGKYTVPADTRRGISRAHYRYDLIKRARARGKQIWIYNYRGTKTPGLQATGPLSDSRMLFLWAALEGAQGVLYGENVSAYRGNPYQSVDRDGEFVLIYPGVNSPVPSARLEQIRDGIEDWEILNAIRQRSGAGAVRSILGGAGLFSATAAKVKLGCTVGCELKTSTAFAWPEYSHDASTPARIERAKRQALAALG